MRSLMLTRYFSLLSLILIGAAGILLMVFVHRQQVQQMEHLAQERNVLTARVFENLLLPDVKRIAKVAIGLSGEALARQDEVAVLRQRLAPLVENTGIAKVKIYALDGLTIFSTEVAQIGQNKSDNAGFRQALQGDVASELTHRDQFSAYEGERNDIDLVSSYLPVYENGQIVAIFELYQEVTNLMTEIRHARLTIGLIIGAVLGILFLFQWLVIRRVQAILVVNEHQLVKDKEQLGEQVEESTQALIKTQSHIEHMHTHDQLTGLPNRLLFHDRLEQAMHQCAPKHAMLAVVLIDLDGFSALNDTRGHHVGDRLLCDVATALDTCVREGDTLARLGGDEFALLVDALPQAADRTAEAVMRIGEKLLAVLRSSYCLPAENFQGTGSLGVTFFGGGDDSPTSLMQQAELAMYQSKEAGRDRLTFFDPSMAEQLLMRTRLETELRRAIAEGELTLHYQPQVDSVYGHVVGAEALVRWQHPERGLISPGEFIPLAEETGLIVQLGQWVLAEACEQLVRWQARPGLNSLNLAVNVSVQQFCLPEFSAVVVSILQRTGANPVRLKLELTESLFAEDIEAVVRTMNVLRAMGIGFSLDDFGTGYSSLAYLSRLPLDQLKIDRAFVQLIGESEDKVPICTAIFSLARGLGLEVVAEGVETEVQRYFLGVVHECDQLQGYLISRPLPVAEFEVFVLEKNEKPGEPANPAQRSVSSELHP